MTTVGFETSNSIGKWSQTYVLGNPLIMDSSFLNGIQQDLRVFDFNR